MSEQAVSPTQAPSAPPASASSGRPQTAPGAAQAPAQGSAPAVQRQFVNFAFYKLDPAFRRLGDHEKFQARSEFLEVFQKHKQPGMICLTYSTVGLRSDADFLLWRIGLSTDGFQQHSQHLNKTRLGAY